MLYVVNVKPVQDKYSIWLTSITVRTKEQRHPWILHHIFGTFHKEFWNSSNYMQHFHLSSIFMISHQTFGDRLQVMNWMTTTANSIEATTGPIFMQMVHERLKNKIPSNPLCSSQHLDSSDLYACSNFSSDQNSSPSLLTCLIWATHNFYAYQPIVQLVLCNTQRNALSVQVRRGLIIHRTLAAVNYMPGTLLQHTVFYTNSIVLQSPTNILVKNGIYCMRAREH